MPIHYQIHASQRKLHVRISGVISDQELLDAVERILNDPLFPKAPRVVWDARERQDVPFSNIIEPLLDLLHRNESSLRGSRCALITSQIASFGMQRMFTYRSDSLPIEVRAFQDLSQAHSWLEGSGADDGPRY
jgi:hypothetical protein